MKAAVYDDKNKECHDNEEEELRRGPWTLEEDTLLIHYVACHGEGRWNLLAKSSGLKRTGKSCRLRWLNYLKPDIKRGNLTPQEQLLILELHSKWGNRWSKIAQHLPGRTDNEIKNYWRTRVQKQAKQLNMESNSQRFIDAIRCFYMPRLVQKIEQSSSASTPSLDHEDSTSPPFKFGENSSIYQINNHNSLILNSPTTDQHPTETSANICKGTYPEVCYNVGNSSYDVDLDSSMSALGAPDVMPHDCHMEGNNWMEDDTAYDPWSCLDELWQFRK